MGRTAKSTRYPHTPDGRYFVVRGRLWRATNPRLAKIEREELTRRLMAARRALRSAKNDDRPSIRGTIDRAKRRLGERGPAWWGDGAPDYNRHLVKNTPYATWYLRLTQTTGTRFT
jgi:hypothetical protein